MNETLLVMFQVGQRIPGINLQVFLPRHGNEATFSGFSTFQTMDYRISKMLKQIFADLFVITRKDHLANAPSFIEIHGTKSQRQ